MKRKMKYHCALLISATLLAPQVANSQRAIAFEGIENGRDMGGIVVEDGRTVCSGMLIRSGDLSKATDADLRVLRERYRLTSVFDFRMEAEAEAAPDRVIDGASYSHLSTLPRALVEGLASQGDDSAQMKKSDMMAMLLKYAFDPKMQAMGRQLYPAIVCDSAAQHYYGRFLRGVLRAEGGVLWHCSQGKDRAGWASAFVLAALGASRSVIVEDFDLSNESYAGQVEAMTAKVRQQAEAGGGNALEQEAVAFVRAMVGVSRENFEATLDLIDQRYGSLPQYIENQLGFSKEEQRQLRAKYLKK